MTNNTSHFIKKIDKPFFFFSPFTGAISFAYFLKPSYFRQQLCYYHSQSHKLSKWGDKFVFRVKKDKLMTNE